MGGIRSPDRAHDYGCRAGFPTGGHRAGHHHDGRGHRWGRGAQHTVAARGAAPDRHGGRRADALPTLKLGPLSAAAPLPTETGLDGRAGASTREVARARSPAWCWTRRRTRCSGSTRPTPRSSPARPRSCSPPRPRCSRSTRRAAWSPGRRGHGARLGRAGRRRRPDPHRAAAGKVGVYPDPARLTDLAAQVKTATGRRGSPK